MSTTTAARLRVALSAGGNKLRITPSARDDSLATWLQTFPACRWDSLACAWVCDATPAAAWMLTRLAPGGADADPPVEALAGSFAAGLDATRLPLAQPALRKHDLWRHQVEAYRVAHHRPACLLHMGMGTGKSAVAVSIVVNEGHRRTIILCPVSVMPVWRREFERHAGAPVRVLVLDGKQAVAKKIASAELFLATAEALRTPAVVVVNYETARTGAFTAWALGPSRRWDCAILDESHRAKGPTTATGRFVDKLGRVAGKRLCLTGTPLPHSPLDLFSQFRFLDRGIFGTSYGAFRTRYAQTNPLFPSKVDRWLRQDELAERAGWITYHVGSEVLDLPEAIHETRLVRLGSLAQGVYDSLEEELIADVHGGTITVANAMVKLLRLQQVTSGYVTSSELDNVPQVLGTEKRDALADLLEDVAPDEPAVVFCRFVHDLDAVADVARALGRTCGEISGRRKDLTPHGTMPEGLSTLAVQIQSGGVGIDLTRARYAVYYSLGFSLGDYEQSLARVHRPGQTRPVTYYHLVAQDTVDQRVYGALQRRAEVVGDLIAQMNTGARYEHDRS